MISGGMKRKHSVATRGAPEDVLQTRITLGIDYGTAAIRAKTDRVRISVSGNSSPETVIECLSPNDGFLAILDSNAVLIGAWISIQMRFTLSESSTQFGDSRSICT